MGTRKIRTGRNASEEAGKAHLNAPMAGEQYGGAWLLPWLAGSALSAAGQNLRRDLRDPELWGLCIIGLLLVLFS